MNQLIYPQIAIVGMKLYEQLGNYDKAFSIGMLALELLRRENSQRYVYPYTNGGVILRCWCCILPSRDGWNA